ncbi:MAG: hypothetical protein R2711_12640 [Acidimicrobiales bacterium]
MSAPEIFGGEARIIDRGYRKYDGPRTGVRGAQRAVVVHSVQRAPACAAPSGRRSCRSRTTSGSRIVPATVFVDRRPGARRPAHRAGAQLRGLLRLRHLGDHGLRRPGGPGGACTDRRSGMLGVYLAAPLDRDTYLLAKAASIAFVVSLVRPPLLMLVANVPSQARRHRRHRRHHSGGCSRPVWRSPPSTPASRSASRASPTGRRPPPPRSSCCSWCRSRPPGSSRASALRRRLLLRPHAAVARAGLQRVHGEWSPIMDGVPGVTVWAAWALWTFGGFARSQPPPPPPGDAVSGSATAAGPMIEVDAPSKWFGDVVAVSDVRASPSDRGSRRCSARTAPASPPSCGCCVAHAPGPRGSVRILVLWTPAPTSPCAAALSIVPQQEAMFEAKKRGCGSCGRLRSTAWPIPTPWPATPPGRGARPRRLLGRPPRTRRARKQRVKVAQALANDPAVMVLDEAAHRPRPPPAQPPHRPVRPAKPRAAA